MEVEGGGNPWFAVRGGQILVIYWGRAGVGLHDDCTEDGRLGELEDEVVGREGVYCTEDGGLGELGDEVVGREGG